MKIERLFDMGVESWNAVFQWGSVGLIAVTFFFGAGALWTANRINERQTERLLVLEKELAEAKTSLAEQQERAAKAEQELTRLHKSVAPRTLDHDVFVASLKGRPKPEGVEILYEPDDVESFMLALRIERGLGAAGVNWRLIALRPFTTTDVVMDMKNAPAAMRAGALSGRPVLVMRNVPNPPIFGSRPESPPVFVLLWALQQSGLEIHDVAENPELPLPDGRIRVVIGRK